jgi:4-amino-4-deoxy-L-arabinose transferase-like glycosyltransferase
VETNQPGHPPSTNKTLLARFGWAVLIIATLYVCYFSHLGAIGFVGPDEPRYAWIARDMMETGDWVTPRLYGKPWFEKPPLFYWGAALSFKLFGVSEAAARLPSAVSALLATLALAWLALRLYGAETARWLLLFLPTTVGMIGFSHAAATDMPFSAMLTIAMVAAAVVVRLGQEASGNIAGDAAAGGASPSPTKTWLALIFFGFFLGLSVLAKGPAGIILCGGSVFFWAIFTKRWRDAFRLLDPVAIAAFCLTALPWYILCGQRNPDFFHIFIIEHNFKRYLTPEFQHIQPLWYYVPITLIALFPWSAWLLGVRTKNLSPSSDNDRRATTIFLFMWAIFPLLFFSISKSKLPGYILPAIPPLLLLLSASILRNARDGRSPTRSSLVTVGVLFIGGAMLLLRDLYTIHPKSAMHWTFFAGPQLVIFISTCAIVGGLAVLGGTLGKRFELALTFAVVSLLLMIFAAQESLRNLDWRISARNRLEVSKISSAQVFEFQMRRDWLYQLNFYLHREVLEWTPAQPGIVVVVTPRERVNELLNYARIVEPISLVSPQAYVLRVQPVTESSGR